MASSFAEADVSTPVPEVDTTQVPEVDTTSQVPEVDTTFQVPEDGIEAPAPNPAFRFPRVGVTAVIQNDKLEFLVGKRKGSHGAGTWQFPGGHQDFGEDYLQCVVREVLEETKLVVKGTGFLTATNDVFTKEKKHYTTIFYKCVMTDPKATPEVVEPDKCEEWCWKSWEELIEMNKSDTEHLFLPLVNLIKDKPNFPEFIALLGL